MTSKRLQILESSLAKKEENFSNKVSSFFGEWHGRQGQPIDRTRASDRALLNRAERKNNAAKTAQFELEKTKAAIEREKNAIARVASVQLPSVISEMIAEGIIMQWRKFPNRFFVVGVDKARIVYTPETGLVSHSYFHECKEIPQRKKFAEVFNKLVREINEKKNV